MLAIVEFQV